MENYLKYLVVDDDEIARMAVETHASRFPFLQKMAVCSHPLEAFELIDRFHPDILFADIEMPAMSGLELVRRVADKVLTPVFITSHPEFAMDSYEIEAFDFLVKPINSARFDRCAFRIRDFYQLREKASAYERDKDSDHIIIKEGYDKYKVYLPDIFYLEAMKDYTKIVTRSGQHLVLATLSGMHDKLPSGKFIRVHRSYIVNRDKIGSIRGNKIHIGDSELPVGKLYKNVLDEII